MALFIKALLLVVVAEMGDKTQLLAMAMASKYKAKQALIGVLIATILNHALAVAAGSYLSSVIPMDLVKVIAAENKQPLLILMGTTVGMLVADSIGILGGAWMCGHIPEIYIKWVAGVIFMFFGTLTLYNSIPTAFLGPIYIVLYLVLMGVLIYLFGVKFAYFDQACDIALPKSETSAEREEQNNSLKQELESEEKIKKRA
jgi:putative Ca2+/H+ antiporter (TMEM165/GDT1 family)